MNSKIGRTSIHESIRMKLWAISAGRCEMCNKPLYEDSTFGVDGNFAENAHIHAVSIGGPRHKYGMTSDEKNNIDNLMLLCGEHHHMIDTYPDDFGEGLLIKRKKDHESRIRSLTDIRNEQSCRIVSFFSNVDDYQEVFSDHLFRQAVVLSGRLPMQQPTIELNRDSFTKYIPSKDVFESKAADLEQSFKTWFDGIVKTEDSIAVFALAPQPLLIKLGTLINDQYNAFPYQCHRCGHKWAWPDSDPQVNFIIKETKSGNTNHVALVIDLSAPVLDDRITSVLGDEVTILHLTISEPNRYFVKSERIQNEFVFQLRMAMEQIKNLRPAPTVINLFPVMPNSLAIRAGMDYMAKSDLPLIIYEQDTKVGGFYEALSIGG